LTIVVSRLIAKAARQTAARTRYRRCAERWGMRASGRLLMSAAVWVVVMSVEGMLTVTTWRC
jgi:hypothetical protein